MIIQVQVRTKSKGMKVSRLCKVEVIINDGAVRDLCQKAAKNKTLRSTAGPVKAVVLRGSIIDSPIEGE